MSLTKHCKTILEQNLVKKDEKVLFVTAHKYDRELLRGFIEAAAELGALGAHMAVVPRLDEDLLTSGLSAWHWNVYSSVDMLVTFQYHALDEKYRREVPAPTTAYVDKVGEHPYRTDHELINRPGGKTRWLEIMMPLWLQRQYFPTMERRERTLNGAMMLHGAKEIRITSEAGSDFVCSTKGRPGHAQYGIADHPGRWDNFGYGCVASMPNEMSAEGTIVLEPGDIIPDLRPLPVLNEAVKLTFRGGYVTNVDGGVLAKTFSKLLASFDDKEAYGTSHVGWGTHEKATLGEATSDEIANYHHNAAGSILFSLGVNYGHGLGGPGTGYSGGGETTRKAKNHTHFALFNGSLALDGEQVVKEGKLVRP